MRTLGKKERLKSSELIKKTFSSGESFVEYPLKAYYLTDVISEPLQMAVSVPKRSFKRAVTRNKIRRRIKEAYRIHKHELEHYCNNHGRKFAILIVYIDKEVQDYTIIEKKIIFRTQ